MKNTIYQVMSLHEYIFFLAQSMYEVEGFEKKGSVKTVLKKDPVLSQSKRNTQLECSY